MIDPSPLPLDIPLAFSRAEYADRLRKTQDEVKRRNLQALLVYSQQSLYYLFGYQIIHGAVLYQLAIVPADGPPIAIIRSLDEPILRSSAFEGDIRCWGDLENPMQVTLAALQRVGLLKNAKLGIETKHQALYPFYYEMLRAGVADSGGILVEASDIITELRVRKSPAEVALMKRAGKFLDITCEAAMAAMKPGARESEVNAAALYAAHMAGADENAQPLLISSGRNTLVFTHLPATQKVIQKGDSILMEAGASAACYHAVGGLTVMCGQEPDQEMRKLYADTMRAINGGKSVLGPGVAVSDLARAMAAAAEGTYTGDFIRRCHGGYGIGIGFPSMWHDSIVIHEKDHHILTPGVTLTLFGMSEKRGHYLIFSAAPVVITETGFEDLCFLEREEMRVVGK